MLIYGGISMDQAKKSFCYNEYNTLKQVILCEPLHMTIRDVINDTQKHFKDEGIHIKKALEQHENFVKTLEKYGVHVIKLPVKEHFPEQVFTRDIGFTIGKMIFVSDMAHKIRQGEEDVFKEWLEQEKISYFNLVADEIEGGDVIVHHNTVYVGVSNRTNEKAIEHLQSLLPHYDVTKIPFTEKYLHLDCVFNIISEHEALVYSHALKKNELKLLSDRFDLIEVSEEEQFTLGTNVLSIGGKRIISLPVNKQVNQQLRDRGYEIIEVDITEIIKSGGSFRCCTLPILRGEK